ncbi:hypothetical protein LOD99_219 [Oopsacas minuta]|uniref:F5/8 type C domain-containing protein n=1 Tax=Oopsacas minuta TaxID=111878 RepID=A0AAV7K9L7_9METZ|nr:hypothetical protein LOD99_219 [Oopsacas minuta]
MLLWDCDERIYKYTISVSVDNQTWTTVVDKSREVCKSWQSLKFEPVPVVFIKIVGTYNSNNEVFHCVHFECPDMSKRDTLNQTAESYSES